MFTISNFEEMYQKDTEAYEKLERYFPENFGAFVTRLDTKSKEFCIEVANLPLSETQVLKTLESFGTNL